MRAIPFLAAWVVYFVCTDFSNHSSTEGFQETLQAGIIANGSIKSNTKRKKMSRRPLPRMISSDDESGAVGKKYDVNNISRKQMVKTWHGAAPVSASRDYEQQNGFAIEKYLTKSVVSSARDKSKKKRNNRAKLSKVTNVVVKDQGETDGEENIPETDFKSVPYRNVQEDPKSSSESDMHDVESSHKLEHSDSEAPTPNNQWDTKPEEEYMQVEERLTKSAPVHSSRRGKSRPKRPQEVERLSLPDSEEEETEPAVWTLPVNLLENNWNLIEDDQDGTAALS